MARAERFTVLNIADRLPDEASAYRFLEELRWNGTPVCAHCESENVTFMEPKNGATRKTRTGNDSPRRVWQCKDCRKQFSATTGTVMHGTRIAIRKWIYVIFEMASSKNGVSAREIERKYELTPRSAWFMLMRLREAMRRDPLAGLLSGIVVADETWIGGAPKNRHKNDPRNPNRRSGKTDKTPVVSLIDKQTGEVRSRVVPTVDAYNLRETIKEHTDMARTTLHTDENRRYWPVSLELEGHHAVNHSEGEYVRNGVSTNVAESYFAQLKRSIDGTHHAVSVKHLPRYLDQWDFLFSTRNVSDTERMKQLVGKVGGKRLTYRPLRSN